MTEIAEISIEAHSTRVYVIYLNEVDRVIFKTHISQQQDVFYATGECHKSYLSRNIILIKYDNIIVNQKRPISSTIIFCQIYRFNYRE